MKLEFLRAVTVEGTRFVPGDDVETDDFPALGSYFESCIRMGHATPAAEPASEVAGEAEGQRGEDVPEAGTSGAGEPEKKSRKKK